MEAGTDFWGGAPKSLQMVTAAMKLKDTYSLDAYSLSRAAATGALSVAERSSPRLKSGAEAGRTPRPRRGGQEELPYVRGQGQWLRVPGCDGAGTAERSYPMSEVRGCSQEELPHAQGQGRWLGGATPPPRSKCLSISWLQSPSAVILEPRKL